MGASGYLPELFTCGWFHDIYILVEYRGSFSEECPCAAIRAL